MSNQNYISFSVVTVFVNDPVHANSVSVYEKGKKVFTKHLLIFLTTSTSGSDLLAVSAGIYWW